VHAFPHWKARVVSFGSMSHPGGTFALQEKLNRRALRWARWFPRLCNWVDLEEALSPPKSYSYYIPEGGACPELWVYVPGGPPMYRETFSLAYQVFEGWGEEGADVPPWQGQQGPPWESVRAAVDRRN
jgi:hypothetical protein